MNKTTVYLTDDLRDAVKREALRRNVAEAVVIRDALRSSLPTERPRPRGGFIKADLGGSIADNVDDWMKGFGER